MKKLLSVAFGLLLAAPAVAQLSPVTFGPKIGLNYNTLTGADNVGDSEYRLGFVGGAFVRATFGKFVLQPEVLYSFKNVKFRANVGNQDVEIDQQNLDVPIMLGVELLDAKLVKLRLMAGPMASFNLNRDLPNTVDENVFNDTVWGFQAGAGVDIGNVTLDLRYERLLDVADSPGLGKPDTGLFQLTAGFKVL